MPMNCFGCSYQNPGDARKMMDSDSASVLEKVESGEMEPDDVKRPLDALKQRYFECVKCLLNDYGRT